jgi:hypothetical protein
VQRRAADAAAVIFIAAIDVFADALCRRLLIPFDTDFPFSFCPPF